MMGTARFDPDCQLHLVDRKSVAARLCRLIGLATVEAHEVPPDDWTVFAGDLHFLIHQTLTEQRRTPDEPALDATLRDVTERLVTRVNGGSSNRVRKGFQAFTDAVANYDCKGCAADRDRVCEGTFRDRRLFLDGEDTPGGACVGFIRKLVECYQRLAEDYFAEYAPDLVLRQAPTDLVVRMSGRRRAHDGTLPIDGHYKADEARQCAVVDIEWPEANEYQDIDDGILMLPYLIFHEVFVHGGQGRALDASIADVPSSCSFTEGAVDAAARHLLMYRVLADPDLLPGEVTALRKRFINACKTYGEARSQAPDPTLAEPSEHTERVQLRRARAAGRDKVWEPLRQIGECFKKPRNWALEIIMRLNLQLNLPQRSRFMMMSDFWDPEQRNLGDVADAFDKYLGSNDVEQLLISLDRLGTPWDKNGP